MKVVAAAKINLFLEVVGRRKDGYHDIRSIVAPISLFDTLLVEEVSGGSVSTVIENLDSVCGHDGEEIQSDGNIATKAALLLKKVSGCKSGVRISIRKEIPIGGGLGGGSSDAAAVLLALNKAWGLGYSRQELGAMAAQIGCDVPALVCGGMVLAEGLGERVTAIEGVASESAWWVALVNPGFRVSTKDIYSRCGNVLTSPPGMLDSMLLAVRTGNVELAGRNLFNGLQSTVFSKYPLIEMIAEALERAGAVGVGLSGSGGTVFGLARNERHARSLADSAVKSLGHPLWRRVSRILPDGVMAAHGPLEA